MRVYIPTPLPNARLLPFIVDEPQGGSRLFQDLPKGSFANLFQRVGTYEDAEVVIVPHEYAVLSAHPEYLRKELQEAQAHGRTVLISAYQDGTAPIRIPNTIVLRSSAYRRTLLPHEIVMPAYVEDLGKEYGHTPLAKGERPTVGFVGKAGFATLRDVVRYGVRNYFLLHGPEREGLYFRRRAIAALSRDARISFSYLARRSFSGNTKSIEVAPEEARRAYVESLQHNLFTLAPRGDGNYSLRFYETLSLGRIPLLIDTDMVLPCEEEIDYDSFVLRIPWQETDRIHEHVTAFFERTSNEELRMMQERARRAFEEHLSMPAFLRRTLTPKILTYPRLP